MLPIGYTRLFALRVRVLLPFMQAEFVQIFLKVGAQLRFLGSGMAGGASGQSPFPQRVRP